MRKMEKNEGKRLHNAWVAIGMPALLLVVVSLSQKLKYRIKQEKKFDSPLNLTIVVPAAIVIVEVVVAMVLVTKAQVARCISREECLIRLVYKRFFSSWF